MKLPVSILAAADGSDENDEIQVVDGGYCSIPMLCGGLVKAVQRVNLCFPGHGLQDGEQLLLGELNHDSMR